MEVTASKPVRAHGRLAKARISAAVVRLHRDKGAQLAGEQVFHHQVKHLEMRVVFSTLLSVYHLVMKHYIPCLIYYVETQPTAIDAEV